MVEKSRKLYSVAKKSTVLSVIVILLLSFGQMPQAHSSPIYSASIPLNNDFPTNLRNVHLASSANNVYAIWQDDANAVNEVFFSSSSDNGTSFSLQLSLSNNLAVDSTVPQVAAAGSNVYVVWQQNDGTGDEIFFEGSTDNGVTFNVATGGTPGVPGTSVNLSNNPSSSVTPSVAASGTNVYVVWQDGFNILYTNSTDNGQTFSAPAILSTTPLTAATSPKVVAQGSNVYVTWLDDNDVFFDKSNDSGASFAGATNISGTGAAQLTQPQTAASGSDIYVVWQDTSPGNNEILLKASNDNGVSFGTTTNLSNNVGFSQVPQITASDSNVYVVWQDDLGTVSTSDVLFERSSDDGSSFNGGTPGSPGAPVNISNNSGTSAFAQLSVAGSDLYVVWQDDTYGRNQIAIISSGDNGNTFSSAKNLSVDTGPATVPHVEANAGDVYVAWNDNTPGYPNLFFVHGVAASIDVSFDKPQYSLHGTASITVTSPVSNLDGTAIDNITPVTVTSTSNPGGIAITLDETGVNTGIFKGNITFTSGASSGTVLHAAPTDAITASFSGQTGDALIFPRAVSFDFPGGYDTGATAVVTVTDQNSVVDASKRESLLAHVTSLASPAGIDLNLTETAPGSGVFSNDQLQFMGGNYLFPLNSSVTVNFEDDGLSGSAILNAHSISDAPGIAANATETSTPHIFSVKFKLTSATSNVTTNMLHVSAGDFVWFAHASAQNRANGMITPRTNMSNGIIQVFAGLAAPDTVTASYLGSSSPVLVSDAYAPGGGGGGIVRPGLILDVAASIASFSKGGSNPVPPTFDLLAFAQSPGALPDNIRKLVLAHDAETPITPLYDNSFDYPLIIDGGGYVLGGYANTIVTKTEKTGVPVDLKLNLAATGLQHLALYTNLRGKTNEIANSDTYVIYDKGQPLQIVDPHGYFAHVNFNLDTQGAKNKADYTITFAKAMEKSDIIFRAWNDRMSSSDVKILGAWQVTEGTQQTSSSQSLEGQTVKSSLVTNQNAAQSDVLTAIKDWGGYSSHSISDSELLSHVGIQGKSIPAWVAKTAKYVVDGDLTPEGFASIVQYLAFEGIVK